MLKKIFEKMFSKLDAKKAKYLKLFMGIIAACLVILIYKFVRIEVVDEHYREKITIFIGFSMTVASHGKPPEPNAGSKGGTWQQSLTLKNRKL